ncbi:malonate decarboxylase holo-ACP synthase [Mixta tenebrionis]|uniref:Malonate decarboxylase holo-ACP synthase n=1 Tax=Mixta tenebrionis TaxID=2562439 RepID=A0A506V3Q5_9GAMM|nr:malonate decarboxylase holo-ACP synthase [Mixta tenebrionis]TPW39763.1 malonate decarboxylase holo-ACP synthase [Mixta tenebrionis]
MLPRPHDLIWLSDPQALQGELPDWVAQQWQPTLPLVVRRDSHPAGLIAVGIRGIGRERRAAAWLPATAVARRVTPESLANVASLLRSVFVSQPPVQGAILLAQRAWPWQWGITGSCGYALATEVPVLHSGSDLDLLIRAPQPLAPEKFQAWRQQLLRLPCRADTQVETPCGAFALNEWLRDGRALLKTNRGPRLVKDPWQAETEV